ncbi:hypothetical protein [Formosa maritima]|nr:hypothetical protein [Formosa maritima]
MKKIIACLFVFLIFSCSTNDDSTQDVYYEILPIESAVLPEEFHLGDVYEITLTYIKPSTCHAFNNIYFEQELNERTLAVVAYVTSGNGNCQPTEIEAEASFDFKAENAGPYIFKFWQGGDNYLVVVVPVVD